MTEITLVLPARTMDDLAAALETLTEHIVNKDPEREVNGVLGGRFSYGAEWSSAVFEMHPYCWSDCNCGQEAVRDAVWEPPKGRQTRSRMRRYYRAVEAIECGTIPMTTEALNRLPSEAVGLRLARIDSKERLILCEGIRFDDGLPAVDTTLRRAAISGRVEIGGTINNHFADVLDDNGDIVETVALDRRSYAALKNHWMRCKVERLMSASVVNGIVPIECLPTCCTALPNFRHHASGLEVRWYKYIGRSMEVVGNPDVARFLPECIADVAAPPFEPWKEPPFDPVAFNRFCDRMDAAMACDHDMRAPTDGLCPGCGAKVEPYTPSPDDEIPF